MFNTIKLGKVLQLTLKNIDPFSNITLLILVSNCFNINKNYFNKSITSDLSLIKKVDVYLELSYIIVQKYLISLKFSILWGPQTSMCINWKRHVDLLVLCGKGNLVYLASGETSQLYSANLLLGLCKTRIFLSIFMGTWKTLRHTPPLVSCVTIKHFCGTLSCKDYFPFLSITLTLPDERTWKDTTLW